MDQITHPEQLRMAQLISAIDNRRMFIVKKNRELIHQQDDNMFLETVRANYSKCYHRILDERRLELAALQTLEQYLADLLRTVDALSDKSLQAEKDHAKTKHEIEKISNELKKFKI